MQTLTIGSGVYEAKTGRKVPSGIYSATDNGATFELADKRTGATYVVNRAIVEWGIANHTILAD